MSFFENFSESRVETPSGSLFVRQGGNGPPLLLLHGNPQTSAMWHLIADTLTDHFSVICPDLPGYGRSDKPSRTPDHALYSKREMARSIGVLMQELGHHSFSIAGHDRGARVAHRMALDFPEKVAGLLLLDIVPTLEHFERTDMDFAMGYYHWFWLAQPHPIPENLINAAPLDWFYGHTSREPKGDDFFHPLALKEYHAAIQNPQTVLAICEDYRAAATIDLDHDRQSRSEGKKIRCPTTVLWGDKGKIGKWYDPLKIWNSYCTSKVRGHSVASGHYLAEEAPLELLGAIRELFQAGG